MRVETSIAVAALLVGGVFLGHYSRRGITAHVALVTLCASVAAVWVLLVLEPAPSFFFEHGLPGWYGAAITHALYRFSPIVLLPLVLPWTKLQVRFGVASATLGTAILYGMDVLGADVIGIFNGVPSTVFDYGGWLLTVVFWLSVGLIITARRKRALT